MKRFLLKAGLIFVIVILAVAIFGCELIFGGVGRSKINSHFISYYDSTFKVELSWNALEDADEYILERKAPDDGLDYVELMWDSLTSFVDHGQGLIR